MPHNILMSKIRCHSPNAKATPVRNRNYINYIATREGVDLTPSVLLSDEDIDIADLETSTVKNSDYYVRYINERPGSQGLFGNLSSEEFSDLNTLSKQIYQISKSKVIFKGIVSLDEVDAVNLGYDKKNTWEIYMKRVMPEIAEAFNIPIENLKWVAAVHMEKAHPHVHYMFWRSDNKIQNPFIHVSLQNKCREILSKTMFEGERTQEIINKNLYRDLLIDFGKEIFSESKANVFDKLGIPGTINSKIMGRIKKTELQEFSMKLLNLAEELPREGRLVYKLLSPELKAHVQFLVEDLQKIPEFKKECDNYLNTIDKISKTYSVVKEKKERNKNKAIEDLNIRLANVIIKAAKEIRFKCETMKYAKLQEKKDFARSCSYSAINAAFNVLCCSHQLQKGVLGKEYKTISKKSRREQARKVNEHIYTPE